MAWCLARPVSSEGDVEFPPVAGKESDSLKGEEEGCCILTVAALSLKASSGLNDFLGFCLSLLLAAASRMVFADRKNSSTGSISA